MRNRTLLFGSTHVKHGRHYAAIKTVLLIAKRVRGGALRGSGSGSGTFRIGEETIMCAHELLSL
jgi:hypothetical protein